MIVLIDSFMLQLKILYKIDKICQSIIMVFLKIENKSFKDPGLKTVF